MWIAVRCGGGKGGGEGDGGVEGGEGGRGGDEGGWSGSSTWMKSSPNHVQSSVLPSAHQSVSWRWRWRRLRRRCTALDGALRRQIVYAAVASRSTHASVMCVSVASRWLGSTTSTNRRPSASTCTMPP